MGNEPCSKLKNSQKQLSVPMQEETFANALQNIENEEPNDLTKKISQEFRRTIIASKNIMIESLSKLKSRKKQMKKYSQPNLRKPLQLNQIYISLQDKMLQPVFEIFTRMKVKRPAFEMIQIDLKKFMKMRQTRLSADYQIFNQIGKGGFGSVFKAREKASKEMRAIKMIKKQTMDDEEKLSLMNQFQILNQMDHPNIIKLYDIYDDQNYFYVVTELCQGGNLLNFVNSSKMDENMMRDVMVQLLSAVRYMHSFNFLHRDIKLQNIVLVNKIKNKDEKLQIKLIDFALPNQQPMGTLMYMSPQCLDQKIALASDIWSCGIVLYMMATRKVPYNYKSDEQLIHRIKKCEIIRKNMHSLSTIMKVFIMQLLEKNQRLRVSAAKAMESPWIKKQVNKFDLSQTKMVKAAQNLLNYDAKNNLISIIESFLVFKKINQAERQRLALIFQQIDRDKSGIIEIEEFKRFYSETSEHYDALEVEELLKIMDKNRSGKIDFNQFIIAMYSRRKLFQLQSLQYAFDYFDKDNSGQISKKQLQSILEGIKHEQVQYLFSQLDKNHDEKISKSEFLAYFNNYERKSSKIMKH